MLDVVALWWAAAQHRRRSTISGRESDECSREGSAAEVGRETPCESKTTRGGEEQEPAASHGIEPYQAVQSVAPSRQLFRHGTWPYSTPYSETSSRAWPYSAQGAQVPLNPADDYTEGSLNPSFRSYGAAAKSTSSLFPDPTRKAAKTTSRRAFFSPTDPRRNAAGEPGAQSPEPPAEGTQIYSRRASRRTLATPGGRCQNYPADRPAAEL